MNSVTGEVAEEEETCTQKKHHKIKTKAKMPKKNKKPEERPALSCQNSTRVPMTITGRGGVNRLVFLTVPESVAHFFFFFLLQDRKSVV